MSLRMSFGEVAATFASSSRRRVLVPVGAGSMKSGIEWVSSPHTAGVLSVAEDDGELTGMPPKASISIRVTVVSGLSATRTSS